MAGPSFLDVIDGVQAGLDAYLGDSLVMFSNRSIGDFVADVTVEEDGNDELSITDHPVETGAAITDHAYKNPATLVLRVGWSNASNQADGPDYVRTVYAEMLALQVSRQPFTVVTGKRTYQNMLIRGLSQTTDQETEQSLFLTIALREIIMVNTDFTDVPPEKNQADPSDTGAVTNGGPRQAVPVDSALLGAAAADVRPDGLG